MNKNIFNDFLGISGTSAHHLLKNLVEENEMKANLDRIDTEIEYLKEEIEDEQKILRNNGDFIVNIGNQKINTLEDKVISLKA